MTSTSDQPDATRILIALRDLKRETCSGPNAGFASVAAAELTQLVVVFDREMLGDKAHSHAELALRAQALGLLSVLDDLWWAMREVGVRCYHLYNGRFREFLDVFHHVYDSLPHVHRRLRAAQTTAGPAYEDGVRAAQDAMASIAADPDFAHFLRVGATDFAPAQIQQACRQLQEFLSFQLAVGPLLDMSLPLQPRANEARPWLGASR